jgi:cytidylate kinase
MAVWTIAAQEGTGGDRIAAELAASACVPLLDRRSLALFAHELEPELGVDELEEVEERFGGRLRMLASSMAMTSGPAAATAAQELKLRQKLPELGRSVLTEAAREPCVIFAPAAFAALRDHPAAIHIRLHAPLACRIAAYQRDHVVDRAHAEKAIKRDDHAKSAWVRSLYHADLDDDRVFTLALDVSRFTPERLVAVLLAAGGAAIAHA